jgi:NAD(P) transhydrogenase subunit alpha
MLKDNIIKIDWTDEVLAKTALTHDGKMSIAPEKQAPETTASGTRHPATKPPSKAA